MPLQEPIFDSRTYREILNEAIARIPAHNPEWTNFNDGDPGITLLQLFAYMTESIIYRANRIPERNHKKFLRLLGMPMQAAHAARGLVSFSNPRGPLEPMTIDAGRMLTAGDVPFRTMRSVQVLPIEAKVYYKSPIPPNRYAEVDALYNALYASYQIEGNSLEYYETKVFETPEAGAVLPMLDIGTRTVDASLWIALLARLTDKPDTVRQRLGGTVLSLGVMPALAAEGLVLRPGGESVGNEREHAGLIFEIPNAESDKAAYTRVKTRTDTNLLLHPGVVEVMLPVADKLTYWDNLDPLESGTGDYPPSLDNTDDQDRLITWIRLRSPEADNTGGGSRQLHIPVSWVGINAAKIRQRAHVEAEQLPTGTGEPDQSAVLSNTPVIENSVRIRVNGEQWEHIDDLTAAAAEVPPQSPRFSGEVQDLMADSKPVMVFTVDRESGEVRFGDGLHGMRPPRGAGIQATYDYGGGRKGTVGIGAINKGENLPQGIKVINPVPTWGGEEGESVKQAEQRITAFIRNRDRLTTKQDIEDIVLSTPGVDLGRRDVLPLMHPDQPFQDSPGVVTIMVIPRNDPVQPDAPRPDSLFLQTICEYLSPRRVLTTELYVRGPDYVPLWLSVSIEVVPGREAGEVLEAVRAAIRRFVSPLTGGFEQMGWPLNRDVEAAEIAAAAARVGGVAKVKQVLVGDGGGEVEGVLTIEGLRLPHLTALEVTTGTAVAIAEIRGSESGRGGAPRKSTPVPVVPDRC
ncbi:MAG: hypothetical protein GF344_12505 [Chitinivibrionales bacterium]|nr:hypothetical protein [Chitinivibrionales bacterium]MBD3357577.1 hypothetical protein [Chitinivibrionales bacterium]